jgi:superfamily II helicase
VTVAVTDKIYVKNHRQIASQLDTRFPKSAFSGATLDVLFQGDLSELNEATRDKVLDFAQDFMDCDCDSNPYCGHPEEKFVRYLLDLRSQGLDPESMVSVMTDDYMVYAYPGDLYGFLDDAVRTLEAVEDLAEVDGRDEAARQASARKRDLTQ